MYTYTWKKYLPVIRLHLKKAVTDEQKISLNRTDFEKTTRLRKPACTFSVELKKGKFSGVNQSVPARDLLDILMEDEGARTLLQQGHYAVHFNSDFQLTIKSVVEPAADTAIEAQAEN
jgi:hypothetical protein